MKLTALLPLLVPVVTLGFTPGAFTRSTHFGSISLHNPLQRPRAPALFAEAGIVVTGGFPAVFCPLTHSMKQEVSTRAMSGAKSLEN